MLKSDFLDTNYARQDVTLETKQWSFVEIANEVNVAFSEFLRLLPVDLLGERWDDYKKQRLAQKDAQPPNGE